MSVVPHAKCEQMRSVCHSSSTTVRRLISLQQRTMTVCIMKMSSKYSYDSKCHMSHPHGVVRSRGTNAIVVVNMSQTQQQK